MLLCVFSEWIISQSKSKSYMKFSELFIFLQNIKKEYLEECINGMALSLEYACIPENSQERQIISLRKKIFNEEIKKRCLAFYHLYLPVSACRS